MATFLSARADVPPGSELIAAQLEELAAQPGWIESPNSPSATPAELAPPDGGFLVGWRGDVPVACGGVKRLEDGRGELKRVYVTTAARASGVAYETIVALEDAARALGYARVRMDTSNTKGRAVCLALGYEEIPDYNGNPNATFWGEKNLSRAVRLYVHRWGEGPRVVLVHGAVLGGREAWRAQRPLTERWTLLAPDRPGHGNSPDARQDFESEAYLIANQLLDEPAHLVGYSYGGIVAMLAAAERPEQVRSLTVVEPPAASVARGDVPVDQWEAKTREVFASASGEDLPGLVGRFFGIAGVPLPVPDPLPETLERGARALIGARPPGEAQIPLDALRAAAFPMLVISGGHHDGYEIVCDAIAESTGADRQVLAGMGHLVPDLGPPFNELLETFMAAANQVKAGPTEPMSSSPRPDRGSKAVP